MRVRARRFFCVSTHSFVAILRLPVFGRAPRGLIIAGLAGSTALSLGGCAQQPQRLAYAGANSKEYFPSSVYGHASPRVIADGEPVPHGGGTYMVGKPYSVAGHTYYPSEKHYAQTGLASWYGTAFHGRRTANGEVYDCESISAAHPTMPLPSYARVTNLRNNYSMIVRVNDRGPFSPNRIMDVSRKTAEALDFRQSGTSRVKVEYIGAASLDGSNDEKLLATLRTDAPATLFASDSRERSRVAETASSHTASAEPAAGGLASHGEASAPDSSLAGRSFAQGAPLPPARPFDLGTIPGAGVPIAMR
jgi:rare lipoprotein A